MNVSLHEDGSVRIATINDVRAVIEKFMPGTESVVTTMSTEIIAGDKKFELSAPVRGANNRDLLMEGFEVIKSRMAIAEKIEEGRPSPVNLDGKMWVDDLIVRELGGIRDGLRIRWDLAEGTIRFDPFTGKLTCSK